MARKRSKGSKKSAWDEKKPAKHSGITRRQFGITVAGIGALAGLGFVGRAIYRAATYDQWAFLKRDNDPVARRIEKLLKSTDADGVMRMFVPVGPYQGRPVIDSNIYEEVKRKISADMKRRGLPYQEPTFRTKLYCVPDEERCREPAENYCRTALDFMASHPGLSMLKFPEVKWKTIDYGDNHSKKYENTIFIGHNYFHVHKISTPNPRKPGENFSDCMAVPQKGAETAFFGEEGEAPSWMVYISSAKPYNFLNSPFSEILPLAVYKEAEKLRKTLSHGELTKLQEAFSESLSHVLLLELSGKMNIPNGEKIAVKALERIIATHTDYSQVQNACDYVENHGIRDTVLLFVNEPLEYRKRIMAE